MLILVLVLKDSLRTFLKSLPFSWFLVQTGMLILVLVLKDSLRTFLKSLPFSWFLGSGPCPGPCGSGPCPYPGPCGLVLALVLVFSPCKNLFPLFHYSDLFAHYCSVNAYN